MNLKVLRTVNVQRQRDCALLTDEDASIVNTEPRGLSARFLIELRREEAGSDEESSERPPK